MKDIYTVVCSDDSLASPCVTTICGSYMTRERAVEACAKKIMDGIETRCDIAYEVFHDSNHKGLREAVLSVCGRDEADLYFFRSFNDCLLPEKVRGAVRTYLTDELKRCGRYFTYDPVAGYEEFRFEIIKNYLKGD